MSIIFSDWNFLIARYVMNMLLLAMCSGLGVFFAATIWQQLAGMAG